jgi:hypothetical protein
MSSLAGLCNPVAIQSYMYLPLKGDTNDYGTGANNPSNTGVATTTGQFGESNGAYEWGSITDRLSWTSSVGNTIANYINSGSTILYFINQRLLTIGEENNILSQGNSFGNYSFSIKNMNRTDLDPEKSNAIQVTLSDNGFNSTGINATEILNYSNWNICSVRYEDNVTDLNVYLQFGSILLDSISASKPNIISNEELRLGAVYGDNNLGDFGKMHTFRIYDCVLQDGELEIIKNQQGQIL